SLTHVLQSITGYTSSSGSVGSVPALGLTLDKSGHLSFDPSALTSDNMAAVQQFLGDTTTGGFIKTANDSLDGVANSNNGILQSTSQTLQNQITSQTNHIADEQTRVDTLQTTLTAQLTEADAAIATLQSQKSFFTNLFAATYLNNTTTGLGGS